ncbi:MAG: histidine--tRNA ligase [Candidatus Melainabacteria bacterium]|nr:MAG: histidine--tRNA ligase [Candidatus Melainabacteria bacterium]
MSTGVTLSSAPPRGMRDMLPEETALRDWATAQLVATYQRFGFARIETPALENIANLRGGEGGENLKLIFEVLKRGDKLDKALADRTVERDELADLGLRFDLTVPLVRFYAANQANLPNPFKAIQIGSVWRAESPQQGRYRQFTQCDIDTFGIKSEVVEMELIQATSEALMALDFRDFNVRLNDRRILIALAEHCGVPAGAFDNVFIQIDKLDKIGLSGVRQELLSNGHATKVVELLLSFLEGATTSKKSAKGFEASLPPNAPEEVVNALRNVLKAIEKVADGRYSICFDPTLVRGMGYYTGQIFEISAKGSAHSIAGGGRYDKMVGKMTGRDVPACGFSIGFERIISILAERSVQAPGVGERIALLFDAERDPLDEVMVQAKNLRKEHIVSLQPKKKEMRKQLDALMNGGYAAYSVFKPGQSGLEIKKLEQSS